MVHSHMPTKWKLKEFLEHHDITVYRLAKETGDQLTRNTLYNLTTKEPKRIELNTIDVLIPALEQLTGKRVELSDLLEYER
jgi:DNA-binding Xre family transcriptional regulator